VNEPAKPALAAKPAAQPDHRSAERRRALRAEVMGLIVIALAILVYTVLRYGAHINWSAR
jgi:hypothetical protein